MKKIFILFAALTLLACEQSETHDGMVKVAFTGLQDSRTKTTYSDGAVLWEPSDKITLLSGEGYGTKTELSITSISDDRDSVRFEGLAASGSDSYIAIYPSADVNTFDNGRLKVNIPSVQTGVAEGFASGANVSVAVVSGKGTDVLQFRNISALISFRFRTAEEAAGILRVTLKARKTASDFHGLTGDVAVSIDGDNVPVASDAASDYVTVEAPQGGFEAGVTYYVPVCPVGECAGMQAVFIRSDGREYVKNNDTACELVRNEILNIDCLPTEEEGGGWITGNTEGFSKAQVRVGIMGDSISTFLELMVNPDYRCHYPCEEDELLNVGQTWWWQLIYDKMDNGVLDVNSSFSGTKVSQGTYAGRSEASYEAGFVDRVEDFHAPDVIIIHGGTNDCIKDEDKVNLGDYQWDAPLDQMNLDKFRSAYVYLVRKLQELYDGVQLILIVGDRLGKDETLQYDDSIIEIAEHFDLPYVDLTPHYLTDIPAPDKCHPNYVGHAFIAQKIYDKCKDYLK